MVTPTCEAEQAWSLHRRQATYFTCVQVDVGSRPVQVFFLYGVVMRKIVLLSTHGVVVYWLCNGVQHEIHDVLHGLGRCLGRQKVTAWLFIAHFVSFQRVMMGVEEEVIDL